MRATTTVLAVALGALSFAGEAQAKPEFCSSDGRPCTRLFVPLDRTGTVPGTVPIQLERSTAPKPVRPPLFLIAGGPGQSSTHAFEASAVDDVLGDESKARDIYVMDPRGTGGSGLLRCDPLQKSGIFGAGAAAGACARQLGPGRAFYTARDAADDIEAVRAELGLPKIALLGVSYGTKVALAYSRRYADRVDRLVLDSVLEAEVTPDPLYRPSFAAVPRVLEALCRRGRCRGFTANPVRDVARLSARLERRPLAGRLVDGRGRARRATLSAPELFTLLLAGDLDAQVRAQFPGLVRSALAGDPAPILRAADRANASEDDSGRPEEFSAAAYAAAICEETALPWSRGAPPADRLRQATAYVMAQPPAVFAPFGPRTALGSDVVSICSQWPEAPEPRRVGGLPAREVPTLMLAGEADVRTPVENARAVAGRLARAQVLEIPDTGHSTLSGPDCAAQAARQFLASATAPARCPRSKDTIAPVPPLPTSVRSLPTTRQTRGKAGRTVTGVQVTMDDVVEQLVPLLATEILNSLTGESKPIRLGGLRGGSIGYTLLRDRLVLRRASVVPGLRVSGTIRNFLEGRGTRATLRISGSGAARGTLRLRNRAATGRLGGRRVRDRLGVELPRQATDARVAVR